MIVQHSSKSNEHYTPVEYIEAARVVMGGIDLDPATTAIVNRELVKSFDYFTEEEDGLARNWWGRVWLNPPGGTVRTGKRTRSRSAIWWAKLVEEYEAGRVGQAIFMGFTLEIVRTSQTESPISVIEFPCCFPKDRIDFLTQIDEADTGFSHFLEQGQPGHANVIAFLPPKADVLGESVMKFQQVFSKFGVVR